MPGRFDRFPKFELDLMWAALYDHRQALINEHGGSYNFKADDVTKLIDELYLAEQWKTRPVRNV
jgi:hypothetical protein